MTCIAEANQSVTRGVKSGDNRCVIGFSKCTSQLCILITGVSEAQTKEGNGGHRRHGYRAHD